MKYQQVKQVKAKEVKVLQTLSLIIRVLILINTIELKVLYNNTTFRVNKRTLLIVVFQTSKTKQSRQSQKRMFQSISAFCIKMPSRDWYDKRRFTTNQGIKTAPLSRS